MVLTSKVINALAENDNHLESIELDGIGLWDLNPDDGYFGANLEFLNKMNVALNSFMTKKSKTLKSLRIVSVNHEIVNEIPFEDFSKCYKL